MEPSGCPFAVPPLLPLALALPQRTYNVLAPINQIFGLINVQNDDFPKKKEKMKKK
jgi:hypothetical protein